MSSIIYTGVFLDPQSRLTLLTWWHWAVPRSPLLDNIHAHHMTIKFRPSKEDLLGFALPFGARVRLRLEGYVFNRSVQAVEVAACTAIQGAPIPCDNAHPHITIATSTRGRPAESNELLEKGPVYQAFGGAPSRLTLYGHIGNFVQDVGVVFDEPFNPLPSGNDSSKDGADSGASGVPES